MNITILKRKWQLFKRSVRDSLNKFVSNYINEHEESESITDAVKEKFEVTSTLYHQLYDSPNIDVNDVITLTSIRDVIDDCRKKALATISQYLLSDQDRSYINGVLSVSTSMLDDIENILAVKGIRCKYIDESESFRIIDYTVARASRR